MRILAVSPFLVYPGVGHAGGEFLYRHMEHQRGHGEVRLVALDTPDNRADLPRSDGALPLLPVPTPGGGLEGRAWRRLVARLDWNVLALTTRQLTAMVAPLDRELKAADVVEVHWAGWLPGLLPVLRKVAPRAVLAVYPYDVPWEADATRAAMDVSERHLARAAAESSFRRFQVRMLGYADLVVVLTLKDQATLEAAGLSGKAVVADPPLEAPSADPGERAAHAPTVLFTADFGRPENHRGALWFLENVWPSIRTRCPDARLLLAGGRPADELRAHQGNGTEVTGYVPSLTPCYAAADVFVAPIPAGGGLKFKVAQAMLYGLPVVATPIAAEGILDRAGPTVFGAVTDNPTTMADAVSDLLADPSGAAAVGAKARQWATSAWDFSASEERIAGLYSALAGRSSVRAT